MLSHYIQKTGPRPRRKNKETKSQGSRTGHTEGEYGWQQTGDGLVLDANHTEAFVFL